VYLNGAGDHAFLSRVSVNGRHAGRFTLRERELGWEILASGVPGPAGVQGRDPCRGMEHPALRPSKDRRTMRPRGRTIWTGETCRTEGSV